MRHRSPDATLASSTITVGTDESTGKFVVNTGDLSGIAQEKAYLIPVTLTSATGCEVQYEDDMTVYVMVSGIARELTVDQSIFKGTQIENPVTCTVNGDDWSDVIDMDNYAYEEIDVNTPIEMDFGKEVNLSSIFVYHYSPTIPHQKLHSRPVSTERTGPNGAMLNTRQCLSITSTLLLPARCVMCA